MEFMEHFRKKPLSGYGSGQFDLDANFSSLHANQRIVGKPFHWSETQESIQEANTKQLQGEKKTESPVKWTKLLTP